MNRTSRTRTTRRPATTYRWTVKLNPAADAAARYLAKAYGVDVEDILSAALFRGLMSQLPEQMPEAWS